MSQKVSTVQTSDNLLSENYVVDVIVTGEATVYNVDEEVQSEYENSSYYPRAAVNQITITESTLDSSVMTVRQTTNYSKIKDCIAIGTVFGKVVRCNTGSGVYPESMIIEGHILHGGIYDQFGSKIGNQGKHDKVSSPFGNIYIGENYYKEYDVANINNFYYMNGSSYWADTIVTVNASRGVSLSVRADIKSLV